MTRAEFTKFVEEKMDHIMNKLREKGDEYSRGDALSNFHTASAIMGRPVLATIAGMMVKHTVSIYDMVNDHTKGINYPMDLWEEKIIDHINYLFIMWSWLHRINDTVEVYGTKVPVREVDEPTS